MLLKLPRGETELTTWDRCYKRYSAAIQHIIATAVETDTSFIEFPSDSHYCVIPPKPSKTKKKHQKPKPISWKPDNLLTTITEVIQANPDKSLMLHMPIFSGHGSSEEGHSVLILFDVRTKTQYILDPLATFDSVRANLNQEFYYAPMVVGFKVTGIYAPQRTLTLQSRMEHCAGLVDTCGLLCVLVAVLHTQTNMSLRHISYSLSRNCRTNPNEAAISLRRFVSWYDALMV
jgi:hypothetical protein